MIYLHEARGADKAITDAIDAHLDDARKKDGDDDDGLSGALVPPVNGTLMARQGSAALEGCSAQCGTEPLTWGFGLERAKGIEPS
jgi:hypothetical protein